ncbi:MAG: zinc ribbon domain-containing protein [candidate division KSB1 bacterium]|nr:zinc ribbon domain-containing protein [candidate division KSB1 bacterium]
MPIYEYRCLRCGRPSSFFVMRIGEVPTLRCRYCGHTEMTRIMSRFAAIRSEEDRLESLADPAKWGDLDENDPKSVVQFMKRMGREFGDELGEDFDQLIEEAEEEAYRAAEKGEEGGEAGETGLDEDLSTPSSTSESASESASSSATTGLD